MPPVEQRKNRRFCKFHGFLGHNTSRPIIFRDMVHKALEEGRLKFGDKLKQPTQVNANPLKTMYSLYVDITDVNVVKVSEEIIAGNFVEPKRATEGHDCNDAMVTDDQ